VGDHFKWFRKEHKKFNAKEPVMTYENGAIVQVPFVRNAGIHKGHVYVDPETDRIVMIRVEYQHNKEDEAEEKKEEDISYKPPSVDLSALEYRAEATWNFDTLLITDAKVNFPELKGIPDFPDQVAVEIVPGQWSFATYLNTKSTTALEGWFLCISAEGKTLTDAEWIFKSDKFYVESKILGLFDYQTYPHDLIEHAIFCGQVAQKLKEDERMDQPFAVLPSGVAFQLPEGVQFFDTLYQCFVLKKQNTEAAYGVIGYFLRCKHQRRISK